MENRNKVVLTGYDYEDVTRTFTEGAKLDRYFNELKSKYPNLIKIAIDVNETLDCDVLIVEDDIDKICKYFRLLEKYPGAEHIIACTKKNAVEYIIEMIKDITRVKLILLDFDLDDHNNDKFSAAEAKSLYEYITERFRHDIRIFGVTGYEGKYDSKNFKDLEILMRERYADLVLNKRFLDDDKIDLFENILRNVYELNERWDERIKKSNLPSSASKLNTSVKPKVSSTQLKIKPATVNSRKLEQTVPLLDRIDIGIKKACPNNVEFIVSKHYAFILTKDGSPMTSYNVLTQEIKKKAEAIQLLLDDDQNLQKWQALRHQISSYGLFSSQLNSIRE